MATPKKDPKDLKRALHWKNMTQEEKDAWTVKERRRNPLYRNPDEIKKGFKKGERPPQPTPETRQRELPICGASRRDGGICCQLAGWGTDHKGVGACKRHGGCVSSHLIKAEVENAKKMAVIYGSPKDIDADTAIMNELARTSGHVEWLGDVIAGYKEKEDLVHVSAFGVSPDPYLKLYKDEREHLVKVAKVAKDMGISERQMTLAEDQGKMIAMVLMAFLRDPALALTPAQMVIAKPLIRKHLLSIEQKTNAIEIEVGEVEVTLT